MLPELLRELHGPSFYAPQAGWFLSAEWMSWQSFSSVHRVIIAGLLPELPGFLRQAFPDCLLSVHVSPAEACLEMAGWLLESIELRARWIAPFGGCEAGYFIRGQYHDLIGQSLEAAIHILLCFFRSNGLGQLLDHHRESALRLRKQAACALSDAFSNAIACHAVQLGLPVDWPIDELTVGSLPPLLQIGFGVNSRLLNGTCTDKDSAIGVNVCKLKHKCHDLLAGLGYPMPRQSSLLGECTSDDFIQEAAAIGYPCVVKPCDSDSGVGVTIDVRDHSTLLQAAAKAYASTARGVLIEEQVPGDYHRLYVIGGELVCISRFRPPCLVGDGVRSVRAILNTPASESLKPGGVVVQSAVSIEGQSVLSQLALQGLSPQSVPACGQVVVLRSDLEDRSDWSVTSFTSKIDWTLSSMACGIAQALSLENAGIDVISPDITQPPMSRRLWVIEVNAFQLLHPAWASVFLEQQFPSYEDARIPIKVFVHVEDRFHLSELQKSLEEHSTDSWAVPRRLEGQFVSLNYLLNDQKFCFYHHPREVLLNRDVRSIIFLIDWDELAQNGLPVLHVDQLQLIGSLSGTRLQQWEDLLKRLGLHHVDQFCCNLP